MEEKAREEVTVTAGEKDSAHPSGSEEKKDPGGQVCRQVHKLEKVENRFSPGAS